MRCYSGILNTKPLLFLPWGTTRFFPLRIFPFLRLLLLHIHIYGHGKENLLRWDGRRIWLLLDLSLLHLMDLLLLQLLSHIGNLLLCNWQKSISEMQNNSNSQLGGILIRIRAEYCVIELLLKLTKASRYLGTLRRVKILHRSIGHYWSIAAIIHIYM